MVPKWCEMDFAFPSTGFLEVAIRRTSVCHVRSQLNLAAALLQSLPPGQEAELRFLEVPCRFYLDAGFSSWFLGGGGRGWGAFFFWGWGGGWVALCCGGLLHENGCSSRYPVTGRKKPPLRFLGAAGVSKGSQREKTRHIASLAFGYKNNSLLVLFFSS